MIREMRYAHYRECFESGTRRHLIALGLFVIAVCLYAHPLLGQQAVPSDAKERAEFDKGLKENPEQVFTFVQMGLGRFGYGITFSGERDESTTEAIQRFQKRHGLKPTGLPDYETVGRILDFLTELDRPIYALPNKIFSVRESTYATLDGSLAKRVGSFSAEGAWNMTRGSASYWKESLRSKAVTIECERSNDEKFERITPGHCIERTAEVSSLFGVTALLSREKYMNVAHWDEKGIITVPEEDGCFEFTMRILIPTERVTLTRVVSNPSAECSNEPNDVEVELVNGAPLAAQWNEAKRALFREVMLLNPKVFESTKGVP